MPDGKKDRSAAQDARKTSKHRSTNFGSSNPYSLWATADQGWTGSSCGRKFEREVNCFGLIPIHEAQVHPRANLPNLVSNVLSDKRSLRVVENNAFLVIKPTRSLVDLSHNRIQPKGKYS